MKTKKKKRKGRDLTDEYAAAMNKAFLDFLSTYTPTFSEVTIGEIQPAHWPNWKVPKWAKLKHGKWKTYPNDNDAVLEQVAKQFPGGVF